VHCHWAASSDLIFWDTVLLCCPGWSGSLYVTQAELERKIILPLLPWRWDYRCAPPHHLRKNSFSMLDWLSWNIYLWSLTQSWAIFHLFLDLILRQILIINKHTDTWPILLVLFLWRTMNNHEQYKESLSSQKWK
jgi:hypothetical protein